MSGCDVLIALGLIAGAVFHMTMQSCLCELYKKPLLTLTDVRERCVITKDILASCETVKTNAKNWMELTRCSYCDAYWLIEYPFSEHHGGGPQCAYRVTGLKPEHWPVGITQKIRQLDEDRAFFDVLGPEVGPENCQHVVCDRLRISGSAFCIQHHFESITGRCAPQTDK